MGDGESFETRPDRLHRYGNFVAAGLLLIAGFVGMATLEGNRALIALGGGVLFTVYGIYRMGDRLVVSPEGVTVNRTPRVVWFDVKSYRYVDTSVWWTPDWHDFPSWSLPGELLLWPFVLLFRWLVYRPARAVVRYFLFKHRDRRFLDAKLELLDGSGEVLVAIEGSDRFVDVAEALDRIIAHLHQQPLAPFSVGAVPLDGIAAMDVGSETTQLRSTMGNAEMKTSEIRNLYLVLEAVTARGARVRIDDDVYVPRALAPNLAA